MKAEWQVKTYAEDSFQEAEFVIPFKILTFGKDKVIGLNLARERWFDVPEQSSWAFGNFHGAKRFGDLKREGKK